MGGRLGGRVGRGGSAGGRVSVWEDGCAIGSACGWGEWVGRWVDGQACWWVWGGAGWVEQ